MGLFLSVLLPLQHTRGVFGFHQAVEMAAASFRSLAGWWKVIVRRQSNQFQIFASGMGGRTVSQFLFFQRANAVSTIEMLAELLTELDRLDQPSREMLLSSLKEPEYGAALVVSSAWLAEGRKATLSKDRGQQVAAEFLRLSFLAEKWSSTDLAVELVCAQVVMLDQFKSIKQPKPSLRCVRLRTVSNRSSACSSIAT